MGESTSLTTAGYNIVIYSTIYMVGCSLDFGTDPERGSVPKSDPGISERNFPM